MKDAIIRNKNKIKYTDVEINGDKITITGIGNKAIKYRINDGEDEFAFYNSSEFYFIACEVLKSFENETWNGFIQENIKAQKEYCAKHEAPYFAPHDGFCTSCHHQIYSKINHDEASNELITGCPICHRSYCD